MTTGVKVGALLVVGASGALVVLKAGGAFISAAEFVAFAGLLAFAAGLGSSVAPHPAKRNVSKTVVKIKVLLKVIYNLHFVKIEEKV